MSEAAKQWEGQIVDGVFTLRQYLGGSDHSAVFLTEYGEREPRRAAIKLYPAEQATADLQLIELGICRATISPESAAIVPQRAVQARR